MKKQKQDNKTVHVKKEFSGLPEILKRLDGEEFILNVPIYEEGQNHERTKSV